MPLTALHDGIDVPDHVARVPWLIAEPELPRYVPAAALGTSPGGWPQLRFTLLGVEAVYGFNFVTHPEARLVEVQSYAPAERDVDEAFRANAAVLRSRLGDPNAVDLPDDHHLMWRDDRVWVNYSASQPEDPAAVRRHTLSVFFHAGLPWAWVPPADRTLAEVVRLLNWMPGVEVAEVRRRSDGATLGLTVRSLESVARLAHMTAAANVGFQVEVDEYRKANGGLSRSDPAGVLYCVTVPAPWEPGPDGYPTRLQILGLYLVGDLREQGQLEEEEARRLTLEFNNHQASDGGGNV